jgi:hypothetical protein
MVKHLYDEISQLFCGKKPREKEERREKENGGRKRKKKRDNGLKNK